MSKFLLEPILLLLNLPTPSVKEFVRPKGRRMACTGGSPEVAQICVNIVRLQADTLAAEQVLRRRQLFS